MKDAGTATFDGYMLRVNELSGTDQVLLDRVDNGAFVNRLTVNRDLAAGDVLLLRAEGSTLEVWQRTATTWSRLGTVVDATYPAAGFAGIGLRGTVGRLDDFGARTLGATPPPVAPGAPTNLLAVPGDAAVSLTWTAPASDGGVPLTGYKVYRGVNGGAKSLLTTVGVAPTSFQDSGLTNGSLYSYEVSAVNQAPLEGPRSNEASATPTPRCRYARRALAARRQLQPRQREPALGCGALVERGVRLRTRQASCHLEPARLHEDNDLRRLEERHPVRTRRRGLDTRLTLSGTGTRFACTPV